MHGSTSHDHRSYTRRSKPSGLVSIFDYQEERIARCRGRTYPGALMATLLPGVRAGTWSIAYCTAGHVWAATKYSTL